MTSQFLWVIFPYICMAVFIVGHIFRYRNDQFGWTAKSSEFIEKKQLMIGSLLFHIGIFPVILGHVAGLGIPMEWTRAMGISDHMYHLGAVWGGGFFGVVTLVGMIILTSRRFTKSNVRKLSSTSDLIVNSLLLFIVFIGVYSSLITNNITPGFDYRATISVWFRSLLIFQPEAAYMAAVPIAFKLHILTGFLIFAMWPFTRLVHVWSVPLNYVGRSYILYRKHQPTKNTPR
ncbi:respiratory nitrate reductase subunit gamma [Mammaliicoccus sciuri]|uniref:Nitrate reductase gamma subunit n=2 Tax=Sporosarcina newyorkensis TaxID=759851 RepID=A0A1T4Y8S1_9BACL|nr:MULTISPECIES: respiratory nitrate reductase subunit gamma [Sporosarcina]EGQ26539.1 respiratory nitrate reductase, gamma subunit [Sporosarcina newyorkensis 2681]MBY0223838.1 respiratory nitrate reductase subunit gamma [Sporosarcina aquimarina]SKA97681.1 nitrate reductase gamma subunit [Sporosarcina newyorkensis]